MNVTSKQVTAESVAVYSLDNGDALRVVRAGRRNAFATYLFDDGREYSARTGRYSRSTLTPALRAAERFDALEAA